MSKDTPIESNVAAGCRTYYDGPSDVTGDVRLRYRYFTYRVEAGLVAGVATTVRFTLDAPASRIWPIFKDFNLWQNQFDHYYSGVIGDLEGKTFSLSLKPNDTSMPHRYDVVRVIPEYLINNQMRVTEDYTDSPSPGFPGEGGVIPGYSVYLLSDEDGITAMTCFLEHAAVMERSAESQGMSEEEALAPWRELTPEWLSKWRDRFIPSLRALVEAA